MTIGLSDEDRELRDSVRGWAARHATPTVIREAVEAKTETRPATGVRSPNSHAGLHLPEKFGGAGYGLVELAIVTEELGVRLFPGPFLPTAVVVHGPERGRPHRRARGSGRRFAVRRRRAAAGRAEAGPRRRQDYAVRHVEPYPSAVRWATCSCWPPPMTTPTRRGWPVVRRGGARSPRRHRAAEPRRGPPQRGGDGHGLELSDGDVLELDSQRILDIAATLFAAEASGLADWATTTAADYAGCVSSSAGSSDSSRVSSTRPPACSASPSMPASPRGTRPARWVSTSTAPRHRSRRLWPARWRSNPRSSHQGLHPGSRGIGFTWEHDAHLYLRRAQSLCESCWAPRPPGSVASRT